MIGNNRTTTYLPTCSTRSAVVNGVAELAFCRQSLH
jgi:hypothetical protein